VRASQLGRTALFCVALAHMRYRPLRAAAIDGVILHLEVNQSIQRCKSAPV
jgi:hypothetical protein